MLRTDDMSKISDSDLLKEGWYQCRISQVKEKDDNGNDILSGSGNPVVQLQLTIQNEGENQGRKFKDSPSLQSHALFKLKAYYKAVGYQPGPEGHDPEKLLDGEVWVYVIPGQYQGNPTLDIKPYSIRSMQQGPGGPGGRKLAGEK